MSAVSFRYNDHKAFLLILQFTIGLRVYVVACQCYFAGNICHLDIGNVFVFFSLFFFFFQIRQSAFCVHTPKGRGERKVGLGG